jgi:hypothetical protein
VRRGIPTLQFPTTFVKLTQSVFCEAACATRQVASEPSWLWAIDLLEIENNPLLAEVGLGALTTVDTLRVRDNPRLAAATFDAVQTFARDMSGNAPAP